MAVIDMRPVDSRTTYQTASESIQVNASPAVGLGNTYYASAGDTITVTANIVNGSGDVQTQLDSTALGYPPMLKMPVTKYAGAKHTPPIDEIYFNTTLVAGVLTATGTIPASGTWVIGMDRLNRSLLSIGADWKINRNDIAFLV